MKELPDRLHNAVVDGLTLLLALRLPGTPAADTVQATAQAWSVALATGKAWDAEQDIPRIQTAFSLLAAQTNRWPVPLDLLNCLPPRPERLKLEYQQQPTPEQKKAAKALVAQLKIKLNGAPCLQKRWIYGLHSRTVDECKHAEIKKGETSE